MKKSIKRLISWLFVKFINNHESEIKKAKKMAGKAQIVLEQARIEADKAEAKYDEVVLKIQEEMIALQEKFDTVVEHRIAEKENFKSIRELADKITNK